MDGHDRVLLALNSTGASASVGIQREVIAHNEHSGCTAFAGACNFNLNLPQVIILVIAPPDST
ncbi:MAG: hypothetical protein MEQ07_07275 [Aquimonas sp.]|nr:hypothetical protein [Aquimonas sp.]